MLKCQSFKFFMEKAVIDFTKSNIESVNSGAARKSRFDGRSFVCGLALAFSLSATSAVAFDLGGIASSVKNLVNIKKNLDSDVRLLTEDAKMLIGSKDKLLLIKNSLVKLATETNM